MIVSEFCNAVKFSVCQKVFNFSCFHYHIYLLFEIFLADFYCMFPNMIPQISCLHPCHISNHDFGFHVSIHSKQGFWVKYLLISIILQMEFGAWRVGPFRQSDCLEQPQIGFLGRVRQTNQNYTCLVDKNFPSNFPDHPITLPHRHPISLCLSITTQGSSMFTVCIYINTHTHTHKQTNTHTHIYIYIGSYV